MIARRSESVQTCFEQKRKEKPTRSAVVLAVPVIELLKGADTWIIMINELSEGGIASGGHGRNRLAIEAGYPLSLSANIAQQVLRGGKRCASKGSEEIFHLDCAGEGKLILARHSRFKGMALSDMQHPVADSKWKEVLEGCMPSSYR